MNRTGDIFLSGALILDELKFCHHHYCQVSAVVLSTDFIVDSNVTLKLSIICKVIEIR